MSEITTQGRAWDYKGGVVIQTSRPDIPNLSDDVVVLWHDNRQITPAQMRKAWVLMGEIAAAQGQHKEDTYNEQRVEFTLRHMQILQGQLFRISAATVSDARAFITMLIELIVENGIPTQEPIYELCEDVGKYVYACLINKRCAVCGAKPDLHHYDAVGMGYNRREINHIGLRALPLCRMHHMEVHNIGQKAFDNKYHLEPITIDEQIAKKYRLKGV